VELPLAHCRPFIISNEGFFYGGLKYFLWRSGGQGDEAVVMQLIPQLVRSVASLLCLNLQNYLKKPLFDGLHGVQ
jgi:hypothetical protein